MAIRKIITKGGVDKYQINVRDAEGVQVKRVFCTLTEAKQEHAKIETAKARGTYVAPSRLPRFGDIAERWINGK